MSFSALNSERASTIIAPATPQGRSAIAAVRISGNRSVVQRVMAEVLGQARLAPRQMALCHARHPKNGLFLDSLLAVYFPGPTSYTGEDVLELFPHGNPLLVRDLVAAVMAVEEVRIADPGEFTRRALEAGKLDLLQAEAVGLVAHAQTERALRNAQRLAAGELSPKIRALADEIRHVNALVELDVDFAEEEADPEPERWIALLRGVESSLQGLVDGYHRAAARERLPSVVLYGPPNAGKSSLANALLHEDRVLVSPVAGTTRDAVELRLLLPGGEVRLLDTAGLGAAQDELDAMAQERARRVLAQAELGVLVLPCQSSPSAELLALAMDRNDLVVASQCDLWKGCADGFPGTALHTSARTGQGLAELLSALDARLFAKEVDEEPWLTGKRQAQAAESALAAIRRGIAIAESSRPAVEILAHELQIARREAASITGEIVAEDVLQAIFSGFCIGK